MKKETLEDSKKFCLPEEKKWSISQVKKTNIVVLASVFYNILFMPLNYYKFFILFIYILIKQFLSGDILQGLLSL